MSSIILIDLSCIFWRYWHQSESEEISTAKRRSTQLVESLISEHDYCAVCVDAPPYNRSTIFHEYKAGREHPPLAVEELRSLVKDLSAIGVPYYASKGFEADDVIATLSRQAKEKDLDVFISAVDKDLLQIEGVKITDPFERKLITPEEKFEVSANMVRDVLALSGDKVDNVPGIPGVGPKTAAKILENIGEVSTFIKLDDDSKNKLYSGFTEKLAESIKNNIIGLEISYELVGLNYDVPIDLKLKESKKTPERIEKNTTQTTPPNDKPVTKMEINDSTQSATNVPSTVVVKSDTIVNADNRNANWSLALEPESLNTAWSLAKYLHTSRMFGQFPNPEAVLSVILRGRSLGIDATTSLSSFHVIEGKPTMHASLIVGLVLNSGKAEYFDLVETNDKVSRWSTKRKTGKHEVVLEYTIEEAEKAGLLKPTRSGKPSNWHTRPKVMLRWRAATELARAIYPDVTTGLYTPEEIIENNTYSN